MIEDEIHERGPDALPVRALIDPDLLDVHMCFGLREFVLGALDHDAIDVTGDLAADLGHGNHAIGVRQQRGELPRGEQLVRGRLEDFGQRLIVELLNVRRKTRDRFGIIHRCEAYGEHRWIPDLA